MKRKEFIKKTSASVMLLSMMPILKIFPNNIENVDTNSLKKVDHLVQNQFNDLVLWMRKNNWLTYLNKILGSNINDLTVNFLTKELININDIKKKNTALNDFGGDKLIEPGYPSLSLLYHLFASPRVNDLKFDLYPAIKQLDALENYIFELKYKDVDLSLNSSNKTVGLAVLSYEYRPAYKTPTMNPKTCDNKIAQLVFSRTGISRIGNKNYNYSKKERSFVNKPKDKIDEKHIAVTPARFGLFFIELVDVQKSGVNYIRLMNYQDKEYTNLGSRYFINPICKLYETSKRKIEFSEFHINEKLYKLSQFKLDGKQIELNHKYNLKAPPFIRTNSSNDKNEKLEHHNNGNKQIVSLVRKGSSVLLVPAPTNIVDIASQDGKNIAFKVTKEWNKNNQSNRRYNAFKATNSKTKEVYDAIITDFIFRRKRRTSRFRAPKNAPLFVNIKFETKSNKIKPIELNGELFEEKICKGGYYAQLFEDGISDGCIAAKVDSDDNCYNKFKILPSFSLVTAPDFFPYLDSNDIRNYYLSHEKEIKMDEHFLEGGTINLSGIRQRGNPRIINPYTCEQAFKDSWKEDRSFDTMTAVVSKNIGIKSESYLPYNKFYERDYLSTSYLPDTGTGIFYPGWDVTYSTEENNEKNPFFATYGLGSPFPEDMKLCAAANGMWPVLSPDAGRTFQGSLERFPILGKPNTSIPLLDIEIGLHKDSSHVKDYQQKETYGWDGEQGPFLDIVKLNKKYVFVNYTDIGRADYIGNILNEEIGFDMSYLRKLDSRELISRLDSLRLAIHCLDKKEVQKTKLWLVSAEKIDEWELGAKCYGIPKSLLLDLPNQIKSLNKTGKGYLYVFAKTRERKIKKELLEPKSKRRLQQVKKIGICCVSCYDFRKESDIHFSWINDLDNIDKDIKWKNQKV